MKFLGNTDFYEKMSTFGCFFFSSLSADKKIRHVLPYDNSIKKKCLI